MAPAAVHMAHGVAAEDVGHHHQGQPHANGTTIGPGLTNEDCGIREVWAHNLEAEFKIICQVVREYNYVAMDTEFPGVVARPIGEFKSSADYQYQLLRCNVDLLKIIQLGVTFLDGKGRLPEGITTWQFNFKFNLTEDMYAEDSVDLLQNSGIQFEKHEQEGIDPLCFAEMMLISGLVLVNNVRWVSFHSGYDFGYLINLLTNQNLPQSEAEFFQLLKLYFPNVYDVKYLMKSCRNLKGGLQEVANEMDVHRVGPQHQAGSDSLLTGLTFFRMKKLFFEDDIDDSKYCGHLFGLGNSYVVPSAAAQQPPVGAPGAGGASAAVLAAAGGSVATEGPACAAVAPPESVPARAPNPEQPPPAAADPAGSTSSDEHGPPSSALDVSTAVVNDMLETAMGSRTDPSSPAAMAKDGEGSAEASIAPAPP